MSRGSPGLQPVATHVLLTCLEQAWTSGLDAQPTLAQRSARLSPYTPEYSWLWLSPLSSANLSLGNTNCLACSPRLSLPSALQFPREASLFPHMAPGRNDGTQDQPFSVSSGKESCAQADWRRRDLVGIMVT